MFWAEQSIDIKQKKFFYPVFTIGIMVGHFLMGPMGERDDDDTINMMHIDASDITFWEGIVKKRDVAEASFFCVCFALTMVESFLLFGHEYWKMKRFFL